MNRDHRKAWFAAALAGLASWGALASRFGVGRAVPPGMGLVEADALMTAVFASLIGGAVLSVGFLVYYYINREPKEPSEGAPESDADIIESSRYEQILAELQGIHLTFQVKGGRSNFAKIARLVRIFLSKLGLHNAQAMDDEELVEAIRASSLNPKDQAVLISVIERCVRGEHLEETEWNFKPLELVRDFKRVVLQIEGKQER